MRTRTPTYLLVSPFALATFLVAVQPSRAGVAACGDIHVEANASCQLEAGVECKGNCEPINFTASCYAECDGQCNVSAEATCTASCQADCSGQCEVDPGSFECQASCEANCSANCDGQCSASGNQAQCQASCEATCEGECGASCEGTPPSATCEAKCQASCEGECSAEVNVDCQVECQGGCTAELTGGCEAECDADGALFCDGQYIDHGGNLEECMNALAEIGIEVEGSASCSGNRCEAEGSASCAAAPGSTGSNAAWFALAAAGLVTAMRRRRR